MPKPAFGNMRFNLIAGKNTGATPFRRLLRCCLLVGLTSLFLPSVFASDAESVPEVLPASRTFPASAVPETSGDPTPPETTASPRIWRAPASSEIRTGRLTADAFGNTPLHQAYEKAQGLFSVRVATSDAGTTLSEARTGSKHAVSLSERLTEAVLPVSSAHAETAVAESKGRPLPSRGLNPVPGSADAEQADAAFGGAYRHGSLGEMTRMRAELEQLRLQVTIEEMRARLQELRSRGLPGAAGAPSLDYPPIGMPDAAPIPARAGGGLRVVSIQGFNGRYSATLDTPQGTRMVRVNDNVNGHRVVSITRDKVVLNRGDGNRTLAVQE